MGPPSSFVHQDELQSGKPHVGDESLKTTVAQAFSL